MQQTCQPISVVIIQTYIIGIEYQDCDLAKPGRYCEIHQHNHLISNLIICNIRMIDFVVIIQILMFYNAILFSCHFPDAQVLVNLATTQICTNTNCTVCASCMSLAMSFIWLSGSLVQIRALSPTGYEPIVNLCFTHNYRPLEAPPYLCPENRGF